MGIVVTSLLLIKLIIIIILFDIRIMKNDSSASKISRIDLNLLVTLHALLETNSTTLAAAKLYRTQSAVSIALGRLRDFFDDPLFIRKGPKLTPTEFALQLQQPLSRLIQDANTLVESSGRFDPKTSDRQITVAIPDIATALTSTIIKGFQQDAPNITIALPDSSIKVTDYSEGITLLLNGKIDLMMSFYVNNTPKGIHCEPLEKQTWSVFARHDHPISNKPSLEEWASYDHIQIMSGSGGRNPIADVMANTKLKRNVGLKVNSFLQALHILTTSDLLLTTMGQLAAQIAKPLNLREIPLPLEVPPVPFFLLTRSTEYDALSAWLMKSTLKYLNA